MKRFTRSMVMVSLALFSGGSFAQFPVTWTAPYQHTVSAGYSNEGRKIVEDASGNIFVIYDVTSDIDPFGIQGTGMYYYVSLRKYSSNGSLVSSVNIDVHNHVVTGFKSQSAFGLEVDASGNIYIGYNTYGNLTNFDVVLAKYSNSLNLLWANTYGTPFGNDQGVDLKLHPSGTLYAIVKSAGTTTVYSLIKSIPSTGNASLVLLSSGNSVVLNSLALDGSQKAYVGGYLNKGFYKAAFVGSINVSTNTLVWSSTYTPRGIQGDNVVNNITVGVDGNIYSAGTSYQGPVKGDEVLVLKNLPSSSRFDFAIPVKGSPANDKGLFINAAESGWLYIGAVTNTESPAIFRIPSTGVFVNAGVVEFHPSPLAPFYNVTGVTMTAMKVSSVKNMYVTGTVFATGPSGDFTCSYLNKAAVVFGNALVEVDAMAVEGDFNASYESIDISLDYSKADVYMLRNFSNNAHSQEIVELVDVNVPSPLRKTNESTTLNPLSLAISPNPASGMILVNSSSNLKRVELMDITGNQVISVQPGGLEITLDISVLAPGIYFCKASTDSGEIVKKFIVN